MIRETPSDDLQRLVERIEGAKSDDPELFWEAHRIVNPEPPTIWKNDQRDVWTQEYAAYVACGHRFGELIDADAYLDAAMTLVPEGAGLSVQRYWIAAVDGPVWSAGISTGGIPSNPRKVFECYDAATAALAVTAASLRARITQEQMDNDTMVAVTPELLPCPSPWCDHRAYVASTDDDAFYGKAFQGRCTQCDMGGPVKRTEAEAVTAWNTRRQSDGCTGAVEALRKALAKIMPITFDDGPDYMSLYFGDGSGAHSTQAMTMHPQDWYDLQTAYEAALSQSTAGEDGT